MKGFWKNSIGPLWEVGKGNSGKVFAQGASQRAMLFGLCSSTHGAEYVAALMCVKRGLELDLHAVVGNVAGAPYSLEYPGEDILAMSVKFTARFESVRSHPANSAALPSGGANTNGEVAGFAHVAASAERANFST